mmetsp:Transcript_10304/g.26168  ORF Transcript_10304/g.26168 Transcript_10304/m.26168 type:complete len:319 (-) Transcript_10304:367-1323(-)
MMLRRDGATACAIVALLASEWAGAAALYAEDETPEALPDQHLVAIDNGVVCAVRNVSNAFSGGALECMNYAGKRLATPFGSDPVAQVSCNKLLCCAVDQATGHAMCWNPSSGMMIESPEVQFVQISVGPRVVCGLQAADRTAICWSHQITGKSHEKALNGRREAVAQVSCGAVHCCAILATSGAVECWGENKHHQLEGPVSERGFSQISAAKNGRFTIALERETGHVFGWGDSSLGEVSNIPQDEPFIHISAGEQFGCGVTVAARKLRCWGRTATLGVEKKLHNLEGHILRSVSAGARMLCVTTEEFRHYCLHTNHFL